MKLNLLCTNVGLKSGSLRDLAKGLSTELGYKVWRTTKVMRKYKQLKYGQAVDKLSQYKWFEQNNIKSLSYTTDITVAKEWLEEGNTVFGRKLLNASCGKGIVVMDKPEDFQPCPVYTLYKKKKREFRVHVFKGTVVNVTEKRRRKDFEGQQDTKIRNLANGYVFCQTVENEPEGLRELALSAANVCASDFRGVDIGYNEKKDELFVIEVNSAPGIQGTNLTKYIAAIKETL